MNQPAKNTETPQPETAPTVLFAQSENGALSLRFAGEWRMVQGEHVPELKKLIAKLEHPEKPIKKLTLELDHLAGWDSALVVVLLRFVDACEKNQIAFDWHGAPEGALRMVELAMERRKEAPVAPVKPELSFEEKVGVIARGMYDSTMKFAEFLGETVQSLGRFVRRETYFRPADFLEELAEAGPRALPIVTLISFLVGLILAFVGSMQLQQFGAQIYVANLVGVAMAREMGAMMTAIIMAGRTGASYAARLGTMQVNEEVDALRTTGIRPMDFLTLPRVLAMLIMMPFLCIYANAIGILGGMSIGVFMLDLAPESYWHQTVEAIKATDFAAGMIKGVVFAFVVALAGCYHGLSCGRSSAAVGKVTTSAVVSAIVFIIISDSILTVVYDILDF